MAFSFLNRKRVGFLLILLLVIGAGLLARHFLGITLSTDDLSPDVLRKHLRSLGPFFPLVCIALVAFRSFMGIPSGLALMMVGIAAGALPGILYATVGLTLSGTAIFIMARLAGREAVEARVPERFRHLLELVGDRPGVLVVLLGTAYPIGVLTPLHALAGISAMPLVGFELALIVGGAIRSATYIYFGSSLVSGEIMPIVQATGVLVAVLVLPLLFPGTRRWLSRMLRPPKPKDEPPHDEADPPPGFC
ncbi:MAG: VTT domain-containing protein [Myxococcota bacterium]|nr:VTT domain-containing protein [Myxococcota bacterium]